MAKSAKVERQVFLRNCTQLLASSRNEDKKEEDKNSHRQARDVFDENDVRSTFSFFCCTCKSETHHISSKYPKLKLEKTLYTKNYSNFTQNKIKVLKNLCENFELFKCSICSKNLKIKIANKHPLNPDKVKNVKKSNHFTHTHSKSLKKKSALKASKDLNKILEYDSF